MSEFVIDEMLLGCLSRCTERIGKAIVGALNNDAKRSKTSRTSDNVHKHRLRAHTEKRSKIAFSSLCCEALVLFEFANSAFLVFLHTHCVYD